MSKRKPQARISEAGRQWLHNWFRENIKYTITDIREMRDTYDLKEYHSDQYIIRMYRNDVRITSANELRRQVLAAKPPEEYREDLVQWSPTPYHEHFRDAITFLERKDPRRKKYRLARPKPRKPHITQEELDKELGLEPPKDVPSRPQEQPRLGEQVCSSAPEIALLKEQLSKGQKAVLASNTKTQAHYTARLEECLEVIMDYLKHVDGRLGRVLKILQGKRSPTKEDIMDTFQKLASEPVEGDEENEGTEA